MKIEEARKIANEKFTKLIQPLLDDPSLAQNEDLFKAQVDALSAQIAKETGYEVERYYINPLGLGIFEITTVFKTGEVRSALLS